MGPRRIREVGWPGEPDGAALATHEWEGSQLMLQRVVSLAEELPLLEADHAPAPSDTVYLRGMHLDSVRGRIAPQISSRDRNGANTA